MTQKIASKSTTKIGAVLSSGGGRGVFAHTGFMLALDRLNIQIRASSGCSAGAVVGGVIASGTSIQDWTAAVLHASVAQYWTPRSFWQLLYRLGFNKGRGLSGMSDTAAAINFISGQIAAEIFEECIYPFVSAAVNLGDGHQVLFNKGPLAPRIMASAAMPGFYEPVEIEGEYFTDGAIIDLAPTNAICCQHKLDVLLVHHAAHSNFSTQELKSSFEKPWTIVNVLHRLIYRRRPWYETGRPSSIHPCPCGCKAVVVVIEPELPELTWPDRSAAENIVSLAQSHALSQLQPIMQSLSAEPRSLLGQGSVL
jgi:predicted acylesterase/phospholipase RssA